MAPRIPRDRLPRRSDLLPRARRAGHDRHVRAGAHGSLHRLAQPDPGRHLGIFRARGADDLRGADVRHRPCDEVAPGPVPSAGRSRCRDAGRRAQPGDHRMAGPRRQGRVVLRIRALDHRHLGDGCQERRPETPACLRRDRDGPGLVVDRLPGQRRRGRARCLSAVCGVAHAGARLRSDPSRDSS